MNNNNNRIIVVMWYVQGIPISPHRQGEPLPKVNLMQHITEIMAFISHMAYSFSKVQH